MSESSETRVNKHLALLLGFSRRQADDLIDGGHVRIDDKIAELGARFDPDTQKLYVDGKPLTDVPAKRYVIFHKPVGYVCSRQAQGDAPTIYTILPSDLSSLKTVGRLDKDSSGILLLTNDGDFAHQMTHPSFHKTKEYEVTLDTDLAPLHRQMISDHGVNLDDGPSKLQLERLTEGDNTRWKVLMHEGRNRQIRRTFSALGYTVTALHRTRFGSHELGELASGETADVIKK